MAESRRTRVYFEDQAPRIGSGWRVVDVVEGDVWARLSTETGRKAKIRIEVFDQIEAGSERMRGL